jgi:hypothetical protein
MARKSTSQALAVGGFMVNEKEFGIMCGQVGAIKDTLDDLDKKLFGNGQPGVIQDLTSSISDLKESIVEVRLGAVSYQKALESHTKDHLPKTIFDKYWAKVGSYLLIAGVVLYEILENVPADKVWAWILSNL